MKTLLAATITVLALAGAWCYAALRVPRVEDSNPTMPPADNLVLGTDIRVALGFALVCLVAVSIPGVVAGGAFESHYNRWYPVYISRGDYSRAGD